MSLFRKGLFNWLVGLFDVLLNGGACVDSKEDLVSEDCDPSASDIFEDSFVVEGLDEDTIKPIPVMNVIKVNFPDSQFYKELVFKNQIVLHHTVSDPKSAKGDVNHWLSDSSRIATAYIEDYYGTFHQCFEAGYWAHHLGVTASFLKSRGFKDYAVRNTLLNKNSIAVEIDSWGGLYLGTGGSVSIGGKMVQTIKGKFYNAYGRVIDSDLEVEEVSWRGFKFFQRYSDVQIERLGLLLSELSEVYKIPSYGLVDGVFDVRNDALSGVSGVFSHTNYRGDKSDIYPDHRIVQLLKNI